MTTPESLILISHILRELESAFRLDQLAEKIKQEI
jgi:hypothetical protein